MYKICKTAQSAERQKQFQEALLAMMEKKKYKKISVTELCKEMGVPRKAFYRYYDSMEDVLDALMDSVLNESFLILLGKPEFEMYFEYWKEHKKLLDVLEKNELSSRLLSRAYAMQFIEGMELKMDVTQMSYACYIAGIIALLITWHHTGMKQTPREMKNIILTVFH